jgi:hypothetical protein
VKQKENPYCLMPMDQATRDCEFCLAELAVIEQRKSQEPGRAA